MKKIILIVVALAFFVGCKNPLFNPKADARLNYFTNTTNTEIVTLTLSGAAPHVIRANITIVNGVDMNFTDCAIEYSDSNNVKVPVTARAKIANAITGTNTNITPVTGYVTFPLTTTEAVNYKAANSLSSMNCLVTLSGEDVNGNQVAVAGSITIY